MASKAGSQYLHDLNVELHVVADDALGAVGLGGEPVENIKRIQVTASGSASARNNVNTTGNTPHIKAVSSDMKNP